MDNNTTIGIYYDTNGIVIYLFIPVYLFGIFFIYFIIKNYFKNKKRKIAAIDYKLAGNIVLVNIIGNKPDDCVICLENKCNIVMIPCMHCILCESCVNILIDKKQMICPICRIDFKKYVLL